MKKLALCTIAIALIGAPAFAADMPVKAPPPAPAPVPTWTGFYGGIQFGGGWGDEAIAYSPNDPAAANLINGAFGIPGEQPVPVFRIRQSGAVGGIEAGYNWQVGTSWLLGLEADFSLAGMNGRGTGSSIFVPVGATQSITAEQSTDWFGTVRGRVGWLATPNLLVFGTGGFAYGRVVGNANLTFIGAGGIAVGNVPPFSFACPVGSACFTGSSAETRTGWTAGGGFEYLFDQHWSAKIEYLWVDLGTETVRTTAVGVFLPGLTPASFNVAFHDRFNVVRLGLNYKFW